MRARRGLIAIAASVVACNGVLGIEPATYQPLDRGGAAGGDDGDDDNGDDVAADDGDDSTAGVGGAAGAGGAAGKGGAAGAGGARSHLGDLCATASSCGDQLCALQFGICSVECGGTHPDCTTPEYVCGFDTSSSKHECARTCEDDLGCVLDTSNPDAELCGAVKDSTTGFLTFACVARPFAGSPPNTAPDTEYGCDHNVEITLNTMLECSLPCKDDNDCAMGANAFSKCASTVIVGGPPGGSMVCTLP